ncbi:MAG: heme exporter protein CcmD [Actinobacteria bacterium]|jgi:heme exporter protein CcmD|nr:heme exporter protein CcmD [Actinomycetota bacterium]NBR66632.1 heme exporter protein CcmD [Actinomycetota bacterium]NBU17134.1 heme exporter protein CcmD [Actinomycetota bacterium]
MEHASFIIASYVLTFGSIAAYAAWVVRRGRAMARRATREEMPWT